MSEPAADSPEFGHLWRSVSKLCDSKIQKKKTEGQMPGTTTSPVRSDFQSPKGRRCGRYPGLYYGDSPGDVEPSQDIFWDSTSPTAANTGLRNSRAVEISDIVNRIAPKDVKQKGAESPQRQWICDSSIPCTPDIPKPRVKKKSSRQSSVDDLLKLARQFDENMQQDRESSEQCDTVVNSNFSECRNTSKAELRETSFPSNLKDLMYPSTSDHLEAELHALFDCSTQKVSGQLSQASSASACSQEVRDRPVTSKSVKPGQTELKSAEGSGPAAQPSQDRGSCGFGTNNCDDFDDDWENDDILNDSFVLSMTQNLDQQLDANPKKTLQPNVKRNTCHIASACKPTASTIAAHQPSDAHSKPSWSALHAIPKPKATNRSTFKLEPNPHFQSKVGAKDGSKSNFTVIQSKPQMSEKTLFIPQPDKIINDQNATCVPEESVKSISDSLWDDGDEDALLYQVCDSVERISSTQPQRASPSDCQKRQDIPEGVQRKTTTPLPIDTARSVSAAPRASRRSPCAFVRSNSLPGTSCEAVNYQGWNIPMKGANSKSQMSQSLPGSHMALGTFNQRRDSSGNFQAGNDKVDIKPHTVTAGAPSKSSHTAFKRNVSDSAVTSNKVFVTSQMTGKCSAAEIERKKQEALARRRLRMQNTPKP